MEDNLTASLIVNNSVNSKLGSFGNILNPIYDKTLSTIGDFKRYETKKEEIEVKEEIEPTDFVYVDSFNSKVGNHLVNGYLASITGSISITNKDFDVVKFNSKVGDAILDKLINNSVYGKTLSKNDLMKSKLEILKSKISNELNNSNGVSLMSGM